MPETSVLELALRLIFSLGVVLAIMAGAAMVLKRTKGFGGAMRRQHSRLDVVARQPLGKHASLAIVHTGGRELVLGVTGQSISLLVDRDAPETPETPGDDPSDPVTTPGTAIVSGFAALPAWKNLLDTMRDRTVRRS